MVLLVAILLRLSCAGDPRIWVGSGWIPQRTCGAASKEVLRAQEDVAWTVGQAVRTRTMWLLIAAMLMALLINAGVGFHLVAYYTRCRHCPIRRRGALSIYALTGAGQRVWGFLSERLPERILASVVMILTSAAILYCKR